MQAYLDNSATTRCSERAKDLMVKVLMEDYGNPSSLHTMGVVAERYIKEAKERIAKTLKADEKEILFTSGGTESNNMALIGTALANKRAGNHIITTSIEHASVLSPLAYLEEQGFRVTYLTVDENGQISLDELRDAVCEDTILVSMMMVNNEIGAVEPIAEAAKIVKEKNRSSMWMRLRHMENTVSVRKNLGLICSRSAVTKFMRQREPDFYISKTKQRLNRLFTAADSRKACAPAQRMFLEQRHLERLPWRSTRILMKRLHICMR